MRAPKPWPSSTGACSARPWLLGRRRAARVCAVPAGTKLGCSSGPSLTRKPPCSATKKSAARCCGASACLRRARRRCAGTRRQAPGPDSVAMQVLAGDADHAVTCKKGRGIQRMHDVVATITCQACRDAGLDARREIMVPQWARLKHSPDGGAPIYCEARLDVVVRSPSAGIRDLYIDGGMRPACATAPGRPGRTARRRSRRPQKRNAATRSAVAWRAARPPWRPWAAWAPSSASSSWSWRSWPRPGPMSGVSLPRNGLADGERSCRASCTKQLRAACMRQSSARVSRGPGPALPNTFLSQTYALARQAASETETETETEAETETETETDTHTHTHARARVRAQEGGLRGCLSP